MYGYLEIIRQNYEGGVHSTSYAIISCYVVVRATHSMSASATVLPSLAIVPLITPRRKRYVRNNSCILLSSTGCWQLTSD
jgi:hypothetical protein